MISTNKHLTCLLVQIQLRLYTLSPNPRSLAMFKPWIYMT
uniref:Uncharacterized protein n=1 Tax=Anguilla anguilla TaxID=7936 RepID=A0A0E9RK54_ANGAN